MKLTLLILIVGLATSYGYLPDSEYGEKLLSLTKKWHDKCVPITGVTQAQIEAVRDGNLTATENVKRYVLCLWFVSDIMSNDFTLNEVMLKELMPKKLAANGAETFLGCAKKAAESSFVEPYEKVWVLVQCFYDSNPADFIMF